MKKEFSVHWTGSKQPRKQRKYLANAPLHIRHNVLSANLSKELRKKYGKRSFPLKKGDEVKIMRGEFKKKTGKIEIVDLKNYRVSIDGIQRSKKDGTKIKIYFHPSNLQIKELNLEDRKRKESIERKLVPKVLLKKDLGEKQTEKQEIKEKKAEDKIENKKENKEVKIKKIKQKPKEIKKHAPTKI